MRLNHWLASASLIGTTLVGACGSGDLVLPNDGIAARIEVVRGNGQSATVTAALPESLVVRVLDSRGRPVVGQRVDFAAAVGAGALTPASPVTDADGEAAAQWVLGSTTGGQSATARPAGNGAPADLVAAFSAMATASRAARVVKLAGDDQSAIAGTAVAIPPSVRVFDATDNPVAGVPVTFAVVSGGGSASPTSPVSTNADGVAAVASWTLGSAAGSNSLTATVGGANVSGSPVTFQATGRVGGANRLVFSVQPVNAAVGAPITPSVEVQIQDAGGNVVPDAGSQVTIALGNSPGGATLSGQTTVNASQGTARFPNLRLSTPGTGYTLRALGSGLTDAISTAFNVVNGASRTEITDISPSSTVVGQQYTVEFSVTAAPPASGTPSGVVTVSAGVGASCQGSVAAGRCALASTTRGTKQVVATYPGDASFAGSASDPESHSVGAASTTIRIQSILPEPSLFGQPFTVRLTLAVNSPGSGQPDGVVNVTYEGGGSCSVPATAAPLECSITPTAADANGDVTARYESASGNFQGDSDTDQHTVRAVSTTTTVTSSDASSDFGQPVSFTAAVSAEPGGGQPTGTVEFRIDGGDFDEVALAGGSAQSKAISTLTPGDHQVRATYRPSGGFATSQGTTTQNVGLIPTSTTASTAPPSSVFQQTITISAAVTRAVGGGTVNDGTVAFYDGGGGCGNGTPLGSDQVSSGVASIDVSTLAVNLHTIWACYGGAAGFLGASGNAVNHEVSRAGSTVIVQTSGSSPLGEPVTVQVTVSGLPSGGVAPSGSVVVSAIDAIGCSAPLDSNGTGSCDINFTTSGDDKQITGMYPGDGNFDSSAGSTLHDVNPAS